jgi:acetyl-CoA carboxylase biotin carboxyl carrier protein
MSKVTASMAGSVWKVLVNVGDHVDEGANVAILESMKMEIPVTAVMSGIVKEILVQEGDFVNEGDVLLEME